MHLRFAWSTLLCWMCACAGGQSDQQGQRCQSDVGCGELVCAADLARAPADLEAVQLHCDTAGHGEQPGEACERAEECDHKLCLLAGACATSCGDARDCSPQQRCQRVYVRATETSLATASACVDDVNLPADARVERRELPAAVSGGVDTLPLAAFAPRTLYVVEHLDDMSWPLPSSLSRCRPPLCANTLRLADDDGRVLFARDRLAELPDGPDVPIAQGNHVDPLTVWIPNGPRLSAEPRDYELEVESKEPGAVRITSLAREADGLRLDLNLYFVGAAGLYPEGTRGPPPLAAALEEVDRIFEPAGIFIGEVRQLSVPGALAERGSEALQGEVSAGFSLLLSQYGVLPELPELLRLSAGAANSALDVFLVSDIESTGSEVGGIAAGTPVAFGMHGGPGSGIAIACDMFLIPGRTRELGRTLAHELGHALGLFHTVEPSGIVFDPLPDTPTCPLSADADHSGSLDAEECAALGGDNLMFPTSDAGDHLSEAQREVLRSALILQ